MRRVLVEARQHGKQRRMRLLLDLIRRYGRDTEVWGYDPKGGMELADCNRPGPEHPIFLYGPPRSELLWPKRARSARNVVFLAPHPLEDLWPTMTDEERKDLADRVLGAARDLESEYDKLWLQLNAMVALYSSWADDNDRQRGTGPKQNRALNHAMAVEYRHIAHRLRLILRGEG
jgi:hypothetical protein